MTRPDAYPCPGCDKPIPTPMTLDKEGGWLHPDAWCASCGGTAERLSEPLVYGPRWYARVAAEFDKISMMSLVLDPDTVMPLWEQALPGAEATATVMEPMNDSPEAIGQEAAERTAMAIAILAYGVNFVKDGPPHTLAAMEADHIPGPERRHYLTARFDITELTDEQRGHLAGEIVAQAEESDHPSVPGPELRWEDEQTPLRRRAVELVKEAYFLDPFVSDQEYGRLMEEADQADQAKEWAAEAEGCH